MECAMDQDSPVVLLQWTMVASLAIYPAVLSMVSNAHCVEEVPGPMHLTNLS